MHHLGTGHSNEAEEKWSNSITCGKHESVLWFLLVRLTHYVDGSFQIDRKQRGRVKMFPILSKWCLHCLAFFQPSLSLNMNSLVRPPRSLLSLPPARLPNDWPQVETHHFILLRTPEDISIVFLVKIWSLKESYDASGSFSGQLKLNIFHGELERLQQWSWRPRWFLCISICTVLWQGTQKIPPKQTYRNAQFKSICFAHTYLADIYPDGWIVFWCSCKQCICTSLLPW